ncbi:hypothetical protein A3D77_02695 [Candidatus Gottesmanbacteria bacterium RIFCSPHIGHO2_02_FULL_39_11]|uniref:DNA polymerase III subunit delta n=1 Tax=Candidatus Gottesmanbacteria bacterium RIFCSPHIGHO2_02_FULL_39_11 TaxID=1798382 RepID=A0A1F5ZT39_9BACT|nr:MAG: hypothetical protein A3D77_02695 [Candidatus Gottesmanbacteria bacterium RIFCSPHIGHO2_02_FULL_39_11]
MISSYLLISDNSKQITKEIDSIQSKYTITPFNRFEFLPETSVGIDLVRKIRSQLINMNAAGYRLVIVHKFETATDEAQNAFLKLLEEPPQDTLILLVAQNGKKILSTVYSRCELIKTEFVPINELESKESLDLLLTILKSSPGKRLQIAGQFNKNKNDAIHFLNRQILLLKQSVLQPPSTLTSGQVCEIISKIESARSYLDANVSSKGVLDILFLGLLRL